MVSNSLYCFVFRCTRVSIIFIFSVQTKPAANRHKGYIKACKMCKMFNGILVKWLAY